MQRIWKALRTALRLGCPRCGRTTLFRGWLAMHERCEVCQLVFEREPGYWIGAIYLNYAVTVGISTVGFLVLNSYSSLSFTTQIALSVVFVTAFPLWFFRYSKSLWLAIDHFFDPDEPSLRLMPRPRV